jgi:AAA domain
MARMLAADTTPTHRAALLRHPGTHNTRYGERRECRIIESTNTVYDISEFDDLFDLYGDIQLLHYKEEGADACRGGNGRAGEWSPPIDVAARFAAMRLEGGGSCSIHPTQLSCTASLLRAGCTVDYATEEVLEATRKAVAGEERAKCWNWEEEEIAIRRMCTDFINDEHPELYSLLPDNLRDRWVAELNEGKRPQVIFSKGPIGWHVRDMRPRQNDFRSAKAAGEGAGGERKYRFKLVSFADLKPGPEPLYLVDELIPVAGLVDVWGKAKCYKSFWCLDLMLHVAMGWEYRDRYVRQGAVVYCAFEGAHGYKKRVEALRRHYQIQEGTPVPLHVMPGQANLIAEHTILIADITAQLGDTRPAAVVLDTLNKSLFGSENKDVDMGAYVRAAEAIRDAFGCVVIIVHHCGYDDTRPRGHSSLPGAVDAQLSVTRAEEIITVTVEMMRDGPEDTQVVSAVEVINVGQDQNGKELTSLVVIPSTADTPVERQGWPRTLSVFHAALKSSLAAHGETFQPEAGVLPVQAVDQRFVRDRFYATYAEAEEDEKKRQAKMQKAFVRALADAQARSMLRARRTEKGRTMLWFPVRGEEA